MLKATAHDWKSSLKFSTVVFRCSRCNLKIKKRFKPGKNPNAGRPKGYIVGPSAEVQSIVSELEAELHELHELDNLKRSCDERVVRRVMES